MSSILAHLHFTDADKPPHDEAEAEALTRDSGTEYVATACIPLFWLCLFSPENIRISPPNALHEYDGQYEPYPYLACARAEALARLKARKRMMERSLGERYPLYTQWIDSVAGELYAHVLVLTEDLIPKYGEAAFEATLRRALTHLDKASATGVLLMSETLSDLAGLWLGESPGECDAVDLLGTDIPRGYWAAITGRG